MEVIIIAAIGRKSEIGKGNDLLWKLPNDMKFFKEKTLGHAVIMGRKTYESIPKKYRPLKDRLNIVISSNNKYEEEGVVMAKSPSDALKIAENSDYDQVFVIGGASIYENLIDKINKMYITEVAASFDDADVFFPENWYKDIVVKNKILRQEVDEKQEYAFTIFEVEKQ